jgi:CHAD domain-containing protein
MPKTASSPMRTFSVLPGLIKRTSKNPTPKAVHKLRTTIRRAETALSTTCDREDRTKLLKEMARMRKAAGHVRDVDVHLSILQGLSRRGVAGDFERLKSHLKKRRLKREGKLTAMLEKYLDGGVVKRLKQSSMLWNGRVVGDNTISVRDIALEFIAKATPPPKVAALHQFRIDCKHLRYSAELAPESQERGFLLTEFKKIQDAVGAWHDVMTLHATAEKLVGRTTSLSAQLRTLAQSRLNEAFRVISKTLAAVRRAFEVEPPLEAAQSALPAGHANRAAA